MMSRLFLSVLMALTLALPAGAASRIKDIAMLQAARDNQLVGGSGDDTIFGSEGEDLLREDAAKE